jgi:membrane-associated phospholipid phosphatase
MSQNAFHIAGGLLAVFAGGTFSVAAAADVVLDWNQQLLSSVAAASTSPPMASRAMAMVHTAVYDAINSVNPTHRGYLGVYAAPTGTSADAAAAQAARDVLASLYPARAAIFDAQLTQSLSTIPDSPGKSAGLALGAHSASQILASRANDNSSLVVPHTPGTQPGQWRPTPPGNGPALLPNWPLVTPFAMSSGSQFRPASIPSLTSPEYTDSYNEVKSLGAVDSATRTAEQTQIAHMWAAGAGTVTPPGMWNQIAAQISHHRSLSTQENARLFALLGIGLADAAIASWDCKYTYNFWRPVNGIREGDTDTNPDTAADATWTPLLITPPFAAFTSGHSTFSSAAASILAGFFGTDNISFSAQSVGITREFESLWAAAEEAGQSRIYGGIHWQFDNTAGLHCGGEIGALVTATQLLVPAPAGGLVLLGVLSAGLRRRR